MFKKVLTRLGSRFTAARQRTHQMCRFAIGSTVFLAATAIGSGAALVAPERTRATGLDFWNSLDTTARMREEKAQQQELEFELQQTWQRAALGNDIAVGLSEDRITIREALDSVAALAERSPDWFAELRAHYRGGAGASAAMTDRNVMAQFIRVRIEQMVRTAELAGDAPRVALLSACLSRLGDEVLRPSPALPEPQSHR